MTTDTLTLATGAKMPLVGFGLWKVPKEDTADTVYNAIKAGYRLFDGAYDYQNEAEAGQGINKAIKDGLVKREELFVVSKLWNNYHERDHALEMARSQLKAWGLDYLDLFLIHFPVALQYIDPKVKAYAGWWMEDGKTVKTSSAPIQETWQALETLVDEGLFKAIGVSNFVAQSLYDLLRYARHPVAALQIEHHPYLTQPDLIEMAQQNKVAVMAYCSFGPLSFASLPGKFAHRPKSVSSLMETDTIKGIASSHKKTPAQVLLRWATQRNIIVIPKSNNLYRLKENLDSEGFDLSKEELAKISEMDIGLRFNDPGYYLDQPLHIFA